MRIEVVHPDGSRTIYYGVNDFDAMPEITDQTVTFWFRTDIAVDERKRVVDGYVTSSISEDSYDERGAYETIGDEAIQENTEVVVGVSQRYPDVKFAAEKLRDEDDFEGDLTILDGVEDE